MLNTLDTVIAFAVIMTVLGLFMTLIVQMVSPTLLLRGLANGLRLTFQTIDPVLPNTRTPSPLKSYAIQFSAIHFGSIKRGEVSTRTHRRFEA